MAGCQGCGAELPNTGKGRPRKWCGEKCRKQNAPAKLLASGIAPEEEVLRMLTEAARDGAVTAMTALLKFHAAKGKRDDNEKPADPFAALDAEDELAKRREQRAS